MTTTHLTTVSPGTGYAPGRADLPLYEQASPHPTSTLSPRPLSQSASPAPELNGAEPTPQQLAMLVDLATAKDTPEIERWPGADWPSEQAFEDARRFIQALPPTSIHLPSIGLADDGEVNFLWKHHDVHIDLGFYGTGSFSYFARAQSDEKYHGDDVPASHGLPHDIVNLIRA